MFGRADQIRWRRSLPRSLLHKRESVRWSAGGSDMMATKQYWRVPCLAQGGSRWDHQVSGVDVASSFPMFDMYPGISTSHTNRPLETNSVSPLRSPGGSGGLRWNLLLLVRPVLRCKHCHTLLVLLLVLPQARHQLKLYTQTVCPQHSKLNTQHSNAPATASAAASAKNCKPTLRRLVSTLPHHSDPVKRSIRGGQRSGREQFAKISGSSPLGA